MQQTQRLVQRTLVRVCGRPAPQGIVRESKLTEKFMQCSAPQCRYLSSHGGDEDERDANLPMNGDAANVNGDDMNPFERLLQHSQQFRQQIAKAGKTSEVGRDGEDIDNDDVLNAENDDESSSSDSSDSSSSESEDDEDDDEDDDDDDDDDDDSFDSRLRDPQSNRGSWSDRNGDSNHIRRPTRRAAQRTIRRIRYMADSELDYEQGLQKLQSTRSRKERMYQQLLHRKQDMDRVCRNCGERGHVAKHCLLPMICSNCGGIGHRMNDCIHPHYNVDDYLEEEHHKKRHRSFTKRAKQHNMMKHHEELKHEFDLEIDTYLSTYESKQSKKVVTTGNARKNRGNSDGTAQYQKQK